MTISSRSLWPALLLCAVACGGTTSSGSRTDTTTDAATGTGGDGAGGAVANTGGRTGGAGGSTGGGGGSTGGVGSGGGPARVPAVHRATATACDATRPYYDAGVPQIDSGGGWPISCRTSADCTAGQNGRCTGNGHDGWQCTYDQCFSDADCPATDSGTATTPGVCACDGGFRSDNNVCLYGGDCRTDADCGGNYCSPTLGSCGHYTNFIAYYCHSPADECIDDADCNPEGGMAYCAFSPAVGHWACSTSECVG